MYESVESRDGCMGGWPSKCYDWSAAHNSHIAKSSDYPYKGKGEFHINNNVLIVYPFKDHMRAGP